MKGRASSSLLLVPLSDEVHFPRTELRLRVVEPEYRELIEDLFLRGSSRELVGTVLLKPEWAQVSSGDAVFGAGTAARLIDLDVDDEGCEIVLLGQYRFEVEKELAVGPGRRAVVRRVLEPAVSEVDPGIRGVRDELIDCISSLGHDLGGRFPLDREQIWELRDDLSFEEVVNLVAARLDLPVLRKLRLLHDNLPDRANNLLAILRNRRQVLDALGPFRHLAGGSELN